MIRTPLNSSLILIILIKICIAQVPIKSNFIFQPDKMIHGHVHASCIVEYPNSDLLACWYEGQTDRSKDVHIQAARLKRSENAWSETFLLADTPTLSDNNPCMIIDQHERLWLFYFTLLGSPEEAWETALLRYKISSRYQDNSRQIVWDIENDLPVIPSELDETVEKLCRDVIPLKKCEEFRLKLKSQLTRRLGWTIRAHPVLLSSGDLLLPMASANFGIAAMAITSDGGETWTFSKSPYGYGVDQPTILERKDGTLVAFMRDETPAYHIRMSESNDHGLTWSPITKTHFPNPGSGLEVIRLKSGNVILIYNDCIDDPRNSLAVSMSDDDGESWQWTRHIEHVNGYGRFDYPSVIQTRDGLIHVTYSYNVETIKHVVFSEEWIKKGK